MQLDLLTLYRTMGPRVCCIGVRSHLSYSFSVKDVAKMWKVLVNNIKPETRRPSPFISLLNSPNARTPRFKAVTGSGASTDLSYASARNDFPRH
jgi:hypothetical protein